MAHRASAFRRNSTPKEPTVGDVAAKGAGPGSVPAVRLSGSRPAAGKEMPGQASTLDFRMAHRTSVFRRGHGPQTLDLQAAGASHDSRKAPAPAFSAIGGIPAKPPHRRHRFPGYSAQGRNANPCWFLCRSDLEMDRNAAVIPQFMPIGRAVCVPGGKAFPPQGVSAGTGVALSAAPAQSSVDKVSFHPIEREVFSRFPLGVFIRMP